VGGQAASSPNQPPRADRPRSCRFCGVSHLGSWASHTCSAPRGNTPPSPATPSPPEAPTSLSQPTNRELLIPPGDTSLRFRQRDHPLTSYGG
jgi:hypothetical protein